METDRGHLRSLSNNLTISLVSLIVVITTLSLLFYYYQISIREKTRLHNTANDYINALASTLEEPLWDLDRENIDRVCGSYNHNDVIVSVKLVGISGELFCHKKSNDRADKATWLTRTKDIFRNGERIGTVSIALSPDRLKKASRDILKVFLTTMLITIAVLVISTGILLNRFLKAPMNYLSRIADAYASGDYHPRIEGTLYREFHPFVSAFVEMGETIESQMLELQKAEESLKHNRKRLEEMVIQRTRELEITNRELQTEVSDRKRTEAKLIANEQRLKAILTASPVGIGLVVDRKLNWANETMYQMVGYEKGTLVGQDASVLYKDRLEYERVGKSLYKTIALGETVNVETRWLRKDGTLFDCSLRACALDASDPTQGQIVAVSDISEAKYLETKLQSAKKLEAIGTLAGGVAHDLNNILSGIISYPEILLLSIPDDSPLKKPLLTIQKSGEKAARIVEDLLTMARRGVSATEVVNLHEIISEQLNSPEMQKLKAFHPDVTVTSSLDADLFNIKGSPTHISKSIMNLISNAAEAMPEGGEITIALRNRYLDKPIKGYEHIKEGEYVEITVSDTGIGMSQNDMDHIFEPFYTKKRMGRSGTGLGMSVVWGTVKDHKGYIDVHSQEGQGTTFTLFFPATRERLKTDSNKASIDTYKGNGESILLVDDVAEQREIASTMLTELGYAVTAAASGEEAIAYMKTNSADLLVIDMIMDPGIDGLDTYRQIVELHPRQKAIIASGFSRTERIEEMQRIGAGQYLKKPYTVAKIGLAIKEELQKA